MSPVNTLGSTEAIQQPDKIRFTKGGGKELVRTWKGALAAIQAKATTLEADDTVSGYTITESPVAVLEATYPDGSDSPSPPPLKPKDYTEWDIAPVELSKPLATHPYFDPDSDDNSSLSAEDKTDLRKQINQIENDLELATKDVANTSYGTGDVLTITEKYKKLRLKGVTNYTAYSYVLRETLKVSSNQIVDVAVSGVGEVSSAPDLADANIHVRDFIASLGGEWLKQAPNVRRFNKSKYQIVTDWQWANEFSPTLYPGGSADV